MLADIRRARQVDKNTIDKYRQVDRKTTEEEEVIGICMLLRQAHNIYLFIVIIVLMCYRPSNPPNESKQYSLENNQIVRSNPI